MKRWDKQSMLLREPPSHIGSAWTDCVLILVLPWPRSGLAQVTLVNASNTLTPARNADDDSQSLYPVAMANLETLTGTF